jgi:uncharacterized protein YciI
MMRSAMTSSLPERLEQLTSRMLRKKLFVVTLKADATLDRMAPYLADHLEYMIELARNGVLFASGPFLGPDGGPTGDGLSIFNTSSADEARNFAENDPFFVHGLRTFEVKEWMADGKIHDGHPQFRRTHARCRLNLGM